MPGLAMMWTCPLVGSMAGVGPTLVSTPPVVGLMTVPPPRFNAMPSSKPARAHREHGRRTRNGIRDGSDHRRIDPMAVFLGGLVGR